MTAPEKSDLDKLNPDIKNWEYGVRVLKSIKVYPLSLSQQTVLSDLFLEAIQKFVGEGKADLANMKDADVIKEILSLITSNIQKIMEMVTDEDDFKGLEGPLHDDLTNNQIVAFGKIIYDVNYKGVLKKVKDLFKILEGESELNGSSPLSSDGTLNTD